MPPDRPSESNPPPESLDLLEARRAEVLSFEWIVREAEAFYGEPHEKLNEISRHHVFEVLFQETGLDTLAVAERLGIDTSAVYASRLSYFRKLESELETASELERFHAHIRERADRVTVETTREIKQTKRLEQAERTAAGKMAVEQAVTKYFSGRPDSRLERDVLCAMLKENGIPVREIAFSIGKGATTVRGWIANLQARTAEDPDLQRTMNEIRELIENPDTDDVSTEQSDEPGASVAQQSPVVEAEVSEPEPTAGSAAKELEEFDIDPEAALSETIMEASWQSTGSNGVGPRSGSRDVREVPCDEQELFKGFSAGNPDAVERFWERYGQVAEEAIVALGPSPTSEAREGIRKSLKKAARYFFPAEHPDFETWARKVIARDLEELQRRMEMGEAIAAVKPKDFVQECLDWREQAKRSQVVNASSKFRSEVMAAKRRADAFLAEGVFSEGSVPDEVRCEVEETFPDEVGRIALASYVLRRDAKKTKEPTAVTPAPAFEDLAEAQQREVMELALARTVAEAERTLAAS